MNPTTVDCYKCSECKNIWANKKMADKCCTRKHCEDCNTVLPSKWYRTVCEPCHEKRVFDRAEKLTPEQWDGWVQSDKIGCNEGYFESVDALIDHCEDEGVDVPEWVFCCTSERHQVDADYALEHMLVDAYEDARSALVDEDEFYAFIEQWNAKQTVESFFADWKRVVILK